MTTINQELEERIARHPCYSEDAHHYFARMHVPVAPACNIQCNYCNRKFDCANESRPGVVSEVLKPEEAVKKVLVVAGEIMQMSVVGIAGPGDPLANPKKTFDTFQGVAEHAPDLKLCLSTNGLRLLEFVDQIQELNIDHVTITINAVDPQIGQHIYSWIFHEGKRYKGLEAAEILINNQLKGLEALTERGILCKVNSVLIPGINDQHMEEVSNAIKKRGAFVHNIMPLIVTPDTVFGNNGIRNPTPNEVQAIQEKCSGSLKMMKHCRQCRADAVGLLGEDRSSEFSKDKINDCSVQYDPAARQQFQHDLEEKVKEKMKKRKERAVQRPKENKPASSGIRIAATTRGNARVNLHFGHAKEFLIFDVMEDNIKFVGVRKVQSYCIGKIDCSTNKGPILAETAEILKDCQMLLSSGIGENPKKYLLERGIVPIVKSGNIEELLYESSKYYRYMNMVETISI
ncbi:nitrogenase cofactor biosynthesis protein NifB [Bacillus sp. 03113]|uniref:nitrogenase cofactor biosynthesis protein NifB n=1 Tax=Bacillus sp. 03113 TaxID=2578211 RepID=UPI001C66132D|nr:nitrogenase cofactor biosynthesis protein NifB [Bacillus sp. 03113]